MTRNELEQLYPRILKNNVEFTVGYKCDDMIPIYNENNEILDYDIVGFELLFTPQESYEMCIKQIEPPTDKMEVLESKVAELETLNGQLLLDQANQNIKLNEQETTNANLLLEIAMLKGVI